MVYVRRDRKRGRSRDATYVSIAHNVREDRGVKKKQPKPIVFAKLGREDDVDKDIADAAAAAMDVYLDLRWKIEQELFEALCERLPEQDREKGDVHGKAVCSVATHRTLKRYVKPGARGKGRHILDQDAIRRERRLAGTRLYRTTAIASTPEATFDSYGMLQQIERNHRDLKGPLRLRPCYHRAERRIRAHVMITILAANCARILEQRSG